MKSSNQNHVEGKIHQVKGKIKENIGKLVNNPDLEAEGKNENLKGKIQEKIGENIAYGQYSSARGMVINLIIDDGVQNRGHRKNQFDPTFAKAGVSCGSHPRYETMCVIDFSSGRGSGQ